MDITPPIAADINYISAYSDSGIKIGKDWVSGDILLSAKEIRKWGREKGIFVLESYREIIDIILDFKYTYPVVLLVGTGKEYVPAPSNLIRALAEHNIAIEFMSTQSACRTYNVLITDGREVFAALAIDQ